MVDKRCFFYGNVMTVYTEGSLIFLAEPFQPELSG